MSDEFNTDSDINASQDIKASPESTSGLDVVSVYKNCFVSGAQDLIPVVIASALWLVTVWIPYINIGTTIAMFTLPVWIVAGKKLSPIDLFLGEHRAKMFGLLRLHGLVLAACLVFFMVMTSSYAAIRVFSGRYNPGFWPWVRVLVLFGCAAVPFFMMTTAWSMAPFLLIDKGLEPAAALKESFRITEGVRLQVFAIYAVPLLIAAVILHFLGGISYVGWIVTAVTVVATATAVIGLSAQVYRILGNKADTSID